MIHLGSNLTLAVCFYNVFLRRFKCCTLEKMLKPLGKKNNTTKILRRQKPGLQMPQLNRSLNENKKPAGKSRRLGKDK